MFKPHRGGSAGGRKGGGGKRFGDKKPYPRSHSASDRGGSYDRGSSDSREGGRPEMHQATCAECNRACEVPFRPSGERPIFCSNCFRKDQNAGGPRRSGGRDTQRSSYGDKPSYGGDKPSYGDKSYSKPSYDRGGSAPVQVENYREQFKALNAKLDMILEALASHDHEGFEDEEGTTEEVEAPKKAVSKKKKAE